MGGLLARVIVTGVMLAAIVAAAAFLSDSPCAHKGGTLLVFRTGMTVCIKDDQILDVGILGR